jgi:eukaryotic-like serine/threonine-protein kinase
VTPALRVAMDLRAAPCKEKVAVFERAARDGDERTFKLLADMRSPDCDASMGVCCMPMEPRLEPTMAQIRARLQK